MLTQKKQKIFRVLVSLFITAVLVGCSTSNSVSGTNPIQTEAIPETNGQTPSPSATETVFTRCEYASSSQMEAIQSGIKYISQANEVRLGWAVKSYDFDNVWMVAAKVYGPGIETGTGPGIWAIAGDLHNPGMVLSVDDIAKEFSAFPDASKTDAAITISDDGVKEVIECLRNE